MLDAFLGHYAYWAAIVVLGIGLYTVSASANLVKKVIGLSIFQAAVFVFYIAIGAVEGATAPIVDSSHDAYANPLPHVLILTAIVVGVATAALALALVVRIHAACGSIEEDEAARAVGASGPAWAGIGAWGVGDGSVGDGGVGDGGVGDGSVGDGSVGDGSVGDGSVGDGSVGDGSVGDGSVGDGSVGDGSVGMSGVGDSGGGGGDGAVSRPKARDP